MTTTTPNLSKPLAEVQKAITNFEAAQTRHTAVGAEDTEPEEIWQMRLWRAFQGKTSQVPNTPDGWDLFDDPKSVRAALDLSTITLMAIEAIGNVPNREREALLALLKPKMWRVIE